MGFQLGPADDEEIGIDARFDKLDERFQEMKRNLLKIEFKYPFFKGGHRGILVIISILCFVLASQAAAQAPVRISPHDLQQLIGNKNVVLINIMSILECRDHQIPGSVCIPCRELAAQVPAVIAKKPERIIVYGDRAGDAADCRAVQQALAGQNVSLLEGGLEAWKRAGFQTVSPDHIPRLPIPALRPQALERVMASENILLVDIRPEQKFQGGHIVGALNIPLDQLHARYNELPNNRRIIVADEDGSRSLFAASYLERKGFRDVGRLSGGMKKWRSATAGEKK